MHVRYLIILRKGFLSMCVSLSVYGILQFVFYIYITVTNNKEITRSDTCTYTHIHERALYRFNYIHA